MSEIVFWVLVVNTFSFWLFSWINKSSNRSNGALDDGTGIVSVFSLAKYFKENPPQNLRLWFCLFNCEEFGQIGAINWIKKMKSILIPEQTYVFNLDMPATINDSGVCIYKTEGIIKKVIAPEVQELIKNVADENNIPLQYTRIIIGKTDRIPFTKCGYKAIDIGSDKAIQWGHSNRDDVEYVDFKILELNCK